MIRTARPPQRRLGRCRPRLERLESRLILSASTSGDLLATVLAGPVSAFDTTSSTALGPNLSWTATVPAVGSTVTTAPTTISITFDRPIDPSFLFGFGDVVIEKPDGAGGWVDASDPSNPPAETLDDSGTTLTLTFAQPLASGTTYQIVIAGSGGVYGLDGSTASPDGSDVVAGQFTVAQPGVTLPDAIPVGPVVATPVSVAGVSVAGTLDLQSDPGAVALYTFTLPAGHHWRLATEAVAQSASGTLISGLALFDSQGHPIATSSLGRPGTPGDAYLYAGLDGGTYYIGVSAYWNLPGSAGGYDPVTGQHGSLPPGLPGQAGGPFHLDIVADRADAPTRLLGFSLNHADPLDPTPTGLTLAFSGLLNLDTLRGTPTSGFEVVNQAGKVFSMTAVGYRETSAQYDFLFDQELPVGHYTVRVVDKADGGATDLAGLSPVAPGQPAGVIATFDVKANHNNNPYDIGPLYNNVGSGLHFGDTILPGTAVTYRFVATVEGLYQFTTQFTGGALSVHLLGPGSLGSSNGGSPGIPQTSTATLQPGVYFLQFINQGTRPLHLSWTISQNTPRDSQLDNGIGQGPALNLRLVNPTSAVLPPDTSPAPSGPTMPATAFVQFGPFNAFGTQIAAITATPSGEPVSSNATVAPAGLALTLGNTLVGRPSAESEHVAVVGPSGPAALALSTSGVPQSISLGQLIGRQASTDPLEGEVETGEAPTTPEPVNGALAAADVQGGARQDELVIAAADWITRAANGAAGWLVLTPRGDSPPESPEAGGEAEAIVMTRDDSPVAGRSEGVQQAQFGPPLAIGLASLMAARFHHPFRRWLRKTHGATASSANKAIRGPHRRF